MYSYRVPVDSRRGFGKHRSVFSPLRTHQSFQPLHADSYVEWVVARLPATSRSTSGSENPFRRNSCRITSIRLTGVLRSPVEGVVRLSLTSIDWGMIAEEGGRRTLALGELETMVAPATLDKP
ncbi:hypothetical protein OUZ56_030133 [Daphnia magna]|uniref:Uncharacterized protein n=1 Tax=Daphnia magna TaxID=35525 RepID=A0ABQ9ZR92_9CRUS|nr:hypothetical protein OUZ56_030133 [Daphnia magna]